MTTKRSTRPRRAFTMIEVLTVGAIAALILALALPAYTWMSESRAREAAAEAISAQIIAARAHAVQHRTYAGISVRQINSLGVCLSRSTGSIHMIQVLPQDVNNPVNNKNFYHLPERGAVKIPRGVGFARGFKPDPGVGNTEMTRSGRFYIIFGPDGILRNGWEVQREFAYINSPTGSAPGGAFLLYDNISTPVNYRFSTYAFGVYDDTRLNDMAGATINSVNLVTSNANRKLRLIYGVTGSVGDPDPGAGAVVQNNLIVKRYFLNPATGLAVSEHDLDP
jgi:type II secretory pathway pseudopilin PulG